MGETVKVGSVVFLKSGGIKMSVHSLLETGWLCQWFSGYELKQATFNEAQLQIVASN